MSALASEVVTEVRRILQDWDEADPVVREDIIRQNVNRAVALMAGELGLNPAWSLGAISVVAGTRSYTLPAGSEYQQVIELRYSSDRRPLRRYSQAVVAAGQAGLSTTGGRQYSYNLEIEPDQTYRIEFPGIPAVDEDIDAYLSTMPATWPIGPGTAPTLPFSERALRACELFTAASCGKSLAEDRLTALDLNPKVFDDWRGEAMKLVEHERQTIAMLKRAHGVGNYAWFAAWGGFA